MLHVHTLMQHVANRATDSHWRFGFWGIAWALFPITMQYHSKIDSTRFLAVQMIYFVVQAFWLFCPQKAHRPHYCLVSRDCMFIAYGLGLLGSTCDYSHRYSYFLFLALFMTVFYREEVPVVVYGSVIAILHFIVLRYAQSADPNPSRVLTYRISELLMLISTLVFNYWGKRERVLKAREVLLQRLVDDTDSAGNPKQGGRRLLEAIIEHVGLPNGALLSVISSGGPTVCFEVLATVGRPWKNETIELKPEQMLFGKRVSEMQEPYAFVRKSIQMLRNVSIDILDEVDLAVVVPFHAQRRICGLALLFDVKHCRFNRLGIVLLRSITKSLNGVFQNILFRIRLQETHDTLSHKASVIETGTLMAAAIHEARRPVSNISAIAGRMLDSGKFEERGLKDVLSESRRIQHVIGSLLQYARLRPAEMAPCELQDCAASAIQRVLPNSLRSTYQVQFLNNSPKITLTADRARLEQALVHLILNAVEAKAQKVTIDAEQLTDGRIRIVVSDDGEGMPEAVWKNWVRPFQSTKREGTGLGLFSTKEIVEVTHGGKLNLSQRKPNGLEATIILPKEPVDGGEKTY